MVNPKIWGNSGWKFLIAIAADYVDSPNIDMQHNYNRFFLHLKWVLPCEICRSNYEEHFKRWPIDQFLKSRAALFRWIMIMYNEVQTSLNKKTKGPQELLYELFGPEEGERMMQRLVYEDPDANITVIKPFDPTIDQHGGVSKTKNNPEGEAKSNPGMEGGGPTVLPDKTLTIRRTTTPSLPSVAPPETVTPVRTFPTHIADMQDLMRPGSSFDTKTILMILFFVLILIYLFSKSNK